MEDKIEIIEIWRPVEEGGQVRMGDKNLDLVAYIVGGEFIRFADGFVAEKSYCSKEQARRIRASHRSK